jgi:cytidine deaminase
MMRFSTKPAARWKTWTNLKALPTGIIRHAMTGSGAQSPFRSSGPELFIGLVAAVGTDHSLLTAILEDALRSFRYQTRVIRLAQLLHTFSRYKNLPAEPADEYIKHHQQAGNEFRHITKNDAALAVLGILPIQQARKETNGDKEKPIPRCAYIIRSLKTPEEVNTLRSIYREAFLLIGSSAPHQMRRRFLATKIASSRNSFQHDQYLPTAEMLIQRDQEEIGKKHGQNLRNAFHLSDIFVDASDTGKLRDSLERGLELIFGNTFHTPTRDEFGIFQATGAAFRSAELGRQVGAAICAESGDIIAIGTNEVPKAGGGLYWTGDDPDHREFRLREDSNDKHKKALLADLLSRLKDDKWLSSAKETLSPQELVALALNEKDSPHVSDAQITDLIEFMRAVHAEMAAITDAARRGVSIANGTLYATTFPCHLCAPHIVASGIRRVVYIEPYAKSLAAQLYPDSIAVDYSDQKGSQVQFEPFVGVAPRMYMSLFSMLKRKRDGKILVFNRETASPRYEGSPRSYISNEKFALSGLQKAIRSEEQTIEREAFRYDKSRDS